MSGEIDLSELQFLPQWAKQPLDANPYKDHQGESADRPRRSGPGRRDNSSRGFSDRRPSNRGPQDRGPRPQGERGPGGPNRGRDQNRHRDQGTGNRDRRGPHRGDSRPPKQEALPSIEVQFLPEPHGLESMIQQIKASGRAYPVYELARMILKKPERHQVSVQVPPAKEGEVAAQLFLCKADQTLWLSEAEALQHLLSKHLEQFYQAEKVTVEPPKGNFTSVGVCGFSGTVFGPPNHHDYPGAIRRLYQERFSNMPFDMFKSRIKVVKDEALINQWKEQQSSKTEYLSKTAAEGAEPVRLPNLDAVRAHFQSEHLASQISALPSATLADAAARDHSAPAIQRSIRRAWESEVRFPSKTGPAMIQALSKNGLQFFKWHKGITHVSLVRPKRFDPEKSPVADGVRNILKWVSENPGKTRSDLLQALAPTPAPAENAPSPEPAAAPASAPTPSPAAAPSPESAAETAPTETAPAPAASPAQETPAVNPSLQTSAVLADLHWLLHEGFVVEFANNQLDMLHPGEKSAAKKEEATPEPVQAAPAVEPAQASQTVQAVEPASETPEPELAQETAPEDNSTGTSPS